MESNDILVWSRRRRKLSLVTANLGLAEILLAIASLSLGCSRDADSECTNLASDAWTAIESVDGQHLECSVDADCGAVPIPSGCWQYPSCTASFVGNKATVGAALASAAKGVAGDLCTRFESRSCTYPAPSCDGLGT